MLTFLSFTGMWSRNRYLALGCSTHRLHLILSRMILLGYRLSRVCCGPLRFEWWGVFSVETFHASLAYILLRLHNRINIYHCLTTIYSTYRDQVPKKIRLQLCIKTYITDYTHEMVGALSIEKASAQCMETIVHNKEDKKCDYILRPRAVSELFVRHRGKVLGGDTLRPLPKIV